jgi:hypothetical protein
MKSHEYDFAVADIAWMIGAPLLPVGLFALIMQLGASLNVFPSPHPTLDMDRTILFHQAEASRSRQDAGIVLIGDSSCLMDVSAKQLETGLGGGHRILNLGTLSYLDLNAYASFLQNYAVANPGRLRAVVLLLHPEALRQTAPSDYHVEAVSRFLNGRDFCDPSAPALFCWLGNDILKGRVLSRAIPTPLKGDYGRRYGFTTDLWRSLSDNQGSAIDPRKFDRRLAEGDAEYRLSKKLESASQAFKAAVPAGVKLFAGITPSPESYVLPGYQQRYEKLLQDWSQWLKPDATLAELPATLPDALFASSTHLTETGNRAFTETLTRHLAALLANPKP